MPDSALGTGTQMWPLPSQGFLCSIQGTWLCFAPSAAFLRCPPALVDLFSHVC